MTSFQYPMRLKWKSIRMEHNHWSMILHLYLKFWENKLLIAPLCISAWQILPAKKIFSS